MAAVPGQLSEAVKTVREKINHSSINSKYGTARLVTLLGESWDVVIQDVNAGMGRNPIYATWDITFNTTDKEYLLPAGVGGLVQIAIPDPTTGRTVGIIPAYGLHEIRGPNWVITPPFIRFDLTFNESTDGRIAFIPRGVDYMHQGSLNVTANGTLIGDDSLVLSVSPSVGAFDPRPNAYIGGMIRVYSAEVLAGYEHWPWEERWIKTYDAQKHEITVNKDWDSNPTGTAVLYEILPMIDPMLMSLACIECARHIVSVEQQLTRVRALSGEYRIRLAAIRRHYSGLNRVREPGVPNKLDMITGRNRRGTRLPVTVTRV